MGEDFDVWARIRSTARYWNRPKAKSPDLFGKRKNAGRDSKLTTARRLAGMRSRVVLGLDLPLASRVEYDLVRRSTKRGLPGITGPRGGNHESLCAESAGVADGRPRGRKVVVPDGAEPRGHRRGVRTLEERPLQLGTLGQV